MFEVFLVIASIVLLGGSFLGGVLLDSKQAHVKEAWRVKAIKEGGVTTSKTVLFQETRRRYRKRARRKNE